MTNFAKIKPQTGELPRHIAIIMDGNGRWAKNHALPRAEGHRKGAAALKETISAAGRIGIEYLTVYAFSTENWNRSEREISALMGLLRLYLKKEITGLNKNGIRLRVIGERQDLPEDIIKSIESAEALTSSNKKGHLTLALSYGGRQELVSAMQYLAKEVSKGNLKPEDIKETDISAALYTADIPDPDLIIRSSGEQRLSNFLPWQAAYAEFYFTDTLWPDFNENELKNAVDSFMNRDRRFGKRTEEAL